MLPDTASLALAGDVSPALVLRVWEAVSSERSVPRVLEAVADSLLPIVPFDGVGLFHAANHRMSGST